MVRLQGEPAGAWRVKGRLVGEGLRINRRGPWQCGLLRKSVLLQMFAGGLGA